jgi:hypothetical protein
VRRPSRASPGPVRGSSRTCRAQIGQPLPARAPVDPDLSVADEGGNGDDQSVGSAPQDVDLGQAAAPRSISHQMDDNRQGRRQLAVQGRPAQARGRAERFEPGRHIRRRVGVHGPAAALVPGVQGSQQIQNLAAAHLADDQSVRTHPQCLPHQVPKGDLAGALLVGGPGLQPHHMRVVGAQFGRVLGEHDARRRIDQSEQAAQQRRLPETETGACLLRQTEIVKTTQPGDARSETQVIRCYVYAHVAQSNPLAIQRQVQAGYALAESLSSPAAEYQVVRVFQDDGGSGLSAHRPAYEEMLAELERCDAAVVLVYREDRLFRDPDLQKAYSEISNRLGVETYSVESGRLGR